MLCLLFLAWTLCGAWRGFAPSISPARIYSRGLEYGHLVQNGVFSMLYALRPGWYVPNAKLRRGHPTLDELSFDEAAAETKKLLLASKQETVADTRFPFLRRRMSFNADARGRNLVILALESMDYAQVDALAGTSYGATPNLDELIRHGVSFENFYACGTDSSLDGIGTLMTGVCRLGGVDYFGRGMESFPISRLGKLFTDNGYNAFFARPARDGWMFIGPLARLTGFKTAGGEDLQKQFQKKKVSDEDALKWLAQQIKSSGKPFLGFFFSLATHEPLGSFMPEHFDPETERKFPSTSYQRALAYTDWSIGRFVADLKASGLYDNTVFVIVGDHILRGAARAGVTGSYRVPFVIVAPGVLVPGVQKKLGGQADVLPTLVDLFHIAVPYAAMGNSLLDGSAPPFAFVSADSGEHFGLVSPDGVGWDDDVLASKKQVNSPALRKKAVALNKAVYESLVSGTWAEK
ncbi:MAG: LTA synthase family protein [Elusimicrobia bacterium]|nr:LTA synthase family protein [Elusimicrobiota bacterium]MDY6039469.1 LTA synthase family protein [Elusimicrobiaceae bacterium]